MQLLNKNLTAFILAEQAFWWDETSTVKVKIFNA
jgi:hypothetical protein